MVGYNVQAAVDTTNHLIVAHEVTNVGTDKSQLANMANQAKAALEAESLEAFADRGYFKGEEILACEEVGITVTLPKPQTSDAKSDGRFGKQDFRYVAEEDIYICPAGEKLAHHFTNEEKRLVLPRYWTNACRTCALKAQCTKGAQRRIRRWEHEYVVDAVQARRDKNPDAMRTRRETVEHPFGTLKMRMGATHFLMKTLPKVATEMAGLTSSVTVARARELFLNSQCRRDADAARPDRPPGRCSGCWRRPRRSQLRGQLRHDPIAPAG